MPQTFGAKIVFILQNYGMTFLRGAGVTMVIAVVSTFIGCVIGFLVGIVQTIPTDRQKNPVKWVLLGAVRFILNVYVEVFRGTPMMVQAMFIFYGASMLFGINMNMWTAAFFIVSINTGAYMAETVRGGILSIDNGQTEGAKAIGMTFVDCDATAIEKIQTENKDSENSSDLWYDLSGRPVNAPVKNGIYIHNGRKVVVR